MPAWQGMWRSATGVESVLFAPFWYEMIVTKTGSGQTQQDAERRDVVVFPQASCSVKLVKQLSQKKCQEGKSFGCSDSSMWTEDCR
eukprot:COSAG06_NODE_41740_length_388_cov_0.878893_1_plen_85_part_01